MPSDVSNAKENTPGKTQSQPAIFRGPNFAAVPEASGEISRRARVISTWIALLVLAILVSQFGRPSRAREAEFFRGAAKVEALGKVPSAAASKIPSHADTAHAGEDPEVRALESKELKPAVYISKKYGVAWQYPRTFVLRKGVNSNLNLAGQPAAASAFAETGGVTLATVSIPARLYPGSDFRSASFTVRVNPRISEAACGQFKISDSDGGAGENFPASQVTVGTIDFAETGVDVEDPDGAPGITTQERFYHTFDNDACYEFAMSVSTASLATRPVELVVNRDDVFDQLAEILTSVTIVPRSSYVAPALEKPILH